jgi:hypothetical protein
LGGVLSIARGCGVVASAVTSEQASVLTGIGRIAVKWVVALALSASGLALLACLFTGFFLLLLEGLHDLLGFVGLAKGAIERKER